VLCLTEPRACGQQSSYIPWAGDLESRTDALSDRVQRVAQAPRQARQPDTTQAPAARTLGPRSADESAAGVPNQDPEPYDGFGTRLFNAYFGKKQETGDEEPNRRPGSEAPFDSPPFPFADYVGPFIGYRDTSAYPLMDALYNGPNGDWWKKTRIK